MKSIKILIPPNQVAQAQEHLQHISVPTTLLPINYILTLKFDKLTAC